MPCGHFHSEALSGETGGIMQHFIFNRVGSSDEDGALHVGTSHMCSLYRSITKEGSYDVFISEFLSSFQYFSL